LITQAEQSPDYYAFAMNSSAECPRTDEPCYYYFNTIFEQSPNIYANAEFPSAGSPRTDEPCFI